ncbi:YceI family protein [Marinigracilibium pacificum]|uniref:YceI family protein n=1 Tax=Marinigracilibium pacificum TaxID=2729599 RepID=A0A848J449_9BACT|nr:YceI family protein [Marinigracilibium pacificum]NMM47952.1 YceI family protein [Marinigracilibium pacificum]
MKAYYLIFLMIGIPLYINAQKYVERNGDVHFYSKAPLEDIEAHSNKGQSIIDLSSNRIAFEVPIKSFDFEKDLMQEHFNENYMESEKFPKATFTGSIKGFDKGKSGKQNVEAEGDITIHGIKKTWKAEGVMKIEGGKITLETEFYVPLDDFDIEKPKVVFYNIADKIKVNLNFEYDEM